MRQLGVEVVPGYRVLRDEPGVHEPRDGVPEGHQGVVLRLLLGLVRIPLRVLQRPSGVARVDGQRKLISADQAILVGFRFFHLRICDYFELHQPNID